MISVPLNKFAITSIATTLLQKIYNQACDLVHSEDGITIAPGKPAEGVHKHFFVKSKKTNSPHYIRISKTGISCDDQCYRFQNSNLSCAHICWLWLNKKEF